MKTTELIKFLQKDVEENGDRDVILETQSQLLPNSFYGLEPVDGRKQADFRSLGFHAVP